MKSLRIGLSPTRRGASRHVAQVRREILRAFAEEKKNRGLTQTQIARALGVHRSVISKELSGRANMTVGRIGELAVALNRRILFRLERPYVALSYRYPDVTGAVLRVVAGENWVWGLSNQFNLCDLTVAAPSLLPPPARQQMPVRVYRACDRATVS